MGISTYSGGLPLGVNANGLQICNRLELNDATSPTKQSSPITVSSTPIEIPIPDNATEILIQATGADLRVGTDATFSLGYVTILDTEWARFPVTAGGSIWVVRNAAVDVTVDFAISGQQAYGALADPACKVAFMADEVSRISMDLVGSEYRIRKIHSSVRRPTDPYQQQPGLFTRPLWIPPTGGASALFGFDAARNTFTLNVGTKPMNVGTGPFTLMCALTSYANSQVVTTTDNPFDFKGMGYMAGVINPGQVEFSDGVGFWPMGAHTSGVVDLYTARREGNGANQTKGWKNRTQVFSGASAVDVGVSNLSIGALFDAALPFFGAVACLIFWDEALSDRKLALYQDEIRRRFNLP